MSSSAATRPAGAAATPTLVLGPGLTLPYEAVTETFAIVAKRGSGKTYCAAVLVEELHAAGLPVIVVDPVGVWWGLRSSADGKGDGLPFVVFGGDHADVPLEATAGELLADLVVDERLPAILDLSSLSKTAQRKLMTDFLERLYHRNREPLHVVLDEADAFAPQRGGADTARLLGAVEDLVRRGRARGLGVSLITQRPAALHKSVLTQAEVLIALRMTGPRDVAAIDEWVRLHADEDQAREVKASLPSLPVGTAWVWSPGWLGVLQQVQVRRRRTFDSSATPKPGQPRAAPRRLAPVDLAALSQRIAATVERARATDPVALRQRVAQLEQQLADERAAPREPQRVEVEVPVLSQDLVQRLEQVLTGLRQHGQQAVDVAQRVLEQVQDATGRVSVRAHAAPAELDTATAGVGGVGGVGGVVDGVDGVDGVGPGPSARAPGAAVPVPVPASAGPGAPARQLDRAPSRRSGVAREPSDAAADPAPLGRAERRILSVLAQHGPRTSQQVALLTAYSGKSGGFRNALSSLRTAGLITGRGEVTITDSGLVALGAFEPLPTGPALVQWWCEQLGKAERSILLVAVDAHPAAVPVPEVAERTGYSATSGGFRNALSRLRTLELVAGRGEIRAADALTAGDARVG